MKTKCTVYQLGLVPYAQAWELQQQLAAEIARGAHPATVLLLEHPHTYTFGRRGHPENLLWDEAERARRGVQVHWVDRGGDITYHGPGQLVGYPLLPLAPGGLRMNSQSGLARLPQADYVGYVRMLEQTLIAALARLGVATSQIPGLTGVWVRPDTISQGDDTPAETRNPPAKIAAIGVKVDVQGVSRHGFALNVDTDMSYWKGIVGCGLKEHPVANLADLLHPRPSMDQVIEAVIEAFGQTFEYAMVRADISLYQNALNSV